MKTMMLVGILLLVACGKSECHDYAVVFCGRYAACVSPVDQDACIQSTLTQMDAAKTSDEQCVSIRDKVVPMTCSQFRALVSSFTN